MVGENGGGAFVLVYLASLIFIGIPVLTAEFMIGRIGGKSMVGTFRVLSEKYGLSSLWEYFGWVANVAVFLVLSFYCVIAGLTIDYTVASFTGAIGAMDSDAAVTHYNAILANPIRLMLYQGLFVFVTTLIVARGVKGGLEKSIRWMMPALFIILLILLFYSAITGEFAETLAFMFKPDFSKMNATVVLNAFGQAFFSLGVGVGVILTYGAYMPKESSITKSSATIALTDGLVAIVAGLAIFPIVFQYNLSPAEGPGLIFMTLPIAFGQMPGGTFIGALFFVLLAFAALSSSISLLESVISRLEELSKSGRQKITWISGFLLWFIGLGTVFSFNIWADLTPLSFGPLEGRTIFGLIDYFASNLIMPIGGILMAIIAGWLMNKEITQSELRMTQTRLFLAWLFLVRYIAPLVVTVIFLSNLG